MQVCEHFSKSERGHVRRSTVGRGRQPRVTPNIFIDYLWKIAPPPIFSHDHCPPVASQNSSSVLSQLKCQLCSNLLTQPLELPCSALVCTKCIVEWVAATGAENCPCCLDDGPLLSSRIRPASNLILLLLADILVHCVSCSRDVKADAYEAHKCTPSLTPNEEREAVVLLKKAISTSTEKGIIHLATGGTPMTFIQVTKARNPTTAVSSRTVKMRCSEMQTMRSIVSGGEPSALIQNEVLVLNDEERRALLQKAGISSTIAIGAAEVLAIKAGLVIPWNKLRLLRRTRRLTWHEGFIPASEVWIKIGGDKGGGTFKMNFQIVNIATPNSVHNTCVFCCFAAGDSVTNLHAALDRFKDQVEHLNGMKWRQYTIKIFICGDFEFLSKMYGLSGASGSEMMATPLSVRGHAAQRTLETMRADHQRYVSAGSIKRDAQKFYNCISPPIFDIPVSQVCPPGLHITLGIFTKMFNLLEAVCCNLDLELALHATDVDSSSFSKYSLELQNLPLLQAELEEAQQAQEKFRQMVTYVVLVGGAERNPRAVNLLKQAADKKKHVKALKLPHRSEEVAEKMAQFITAFSLFGKCHNICDQNFIEEAHVHALDSAVHEFMAFFRGTFADATTPIKMHLLEDHATQWANATHVGFGLLGEQGAESIHAKFNRLGLAFAPIKDKVKQLQCIVKEHLLSIEPQIVAAIPPPTKRIKLTQT
ncbi:hypothetical protein EMCRGX_G018128 [Ephydatia muelleri]